MRTVAIMPAQALRRGRMPFTILTLIAPRTIAQVAWTTKCRQMSDRHPVILPMQFRDPFPTFPTGRSNLRALDRNYDFSPLIYRSLQDPYIRNIERYCDLRFRHVGFPVFTGFLSLILSLHLAAITATPNEPLSFNSRCCRYTVFPGSPSFPDQRTSVSSSFDRTYKLFNKKCNKLPMPWATRRAMLNKKGAYHDS